MERPRHEAGFCGFVSGVAGVFGIWLGRVTSWTRIVASVAVMSCIYEPTDFIARGMFTGFDHSFCLINSKRFQIRSAIKPYPPDLYNPPLQARNNLTLPRRSLLPNLNTHPPTPIPRLKLPPLLLPHTRRRIHIPMRPHDPLKHHRRALPLHPLTRPKRPHNATLKIPREQRRRRRAQRVHDAETVRIGSIVLGGRRAHDPVHTGSVHAAGEEGERLAGQQRGRQSARARDGARGEVGLIFDGDPGVGGRIERLQAGGAADDEGEQAEVLVLLGVDSGPRGRGGGAVVAEHADEGRGALGAGEGGAGGDEGGEDGRVEGEGVGDRGGDAGQESAGEVPGCLQLRAEGRGAVGGGFDRHDAFLVRDLRVPFFARGGAAGGLVVGLFGGVGGQVEEIGGLGEELGVCFYHSGVV